MDTIVLNRMKENETYRSVVVECGNSFSKDFSDSCCRLSIMLRQSPLGEDRGSVFDFEIPKSLVKH